MVYIPTKLRDLVHERAKWHCEYCRASEDIIVVMQIDHIQPIAVDGKTETDNLCLACQPCNGSKSDFQIGIDPKTGEELALFNPRTHKWSEHFSWSEDFTKLVGLSAIGRATINRLNMNRYKLLRARKLWRKAGWLPLDD